MNLLDRARLFATKAHEGQVRKATNTPMISHPIRVAETLKEAGFSDEVIAAGYLHDTVEDTSVTQEDIFKEFGKEVSLIVQGNTENKDHSWEMRKQHTIDWVAKAPLEIKALIVADKLDNLQSLIKDYETLGEELWTNFKRGKEQQAWYFKGVATNMYKGLNLEKAPLFFALYEQKVEEFFEN